METGEKPAAARAQPQAPPRWLVLTIASCVLAVIGLMVWLSTAKAMTLAQYTEHRKTAKVFLGSFVITGVVKRTGYSDYQSVPTADGRGMKQLVLEADGAKATVWYDPGRFDAVPEKGDRARVKGDFQSILFVGVGAPMKRETIGVATRIDAVPEDDGT